MLRHLFHWPEYSFILAIEIKNAQALNAPSS